MCLTLHFHCLLFMPVFIHVLIAISAAVTTTIIPPC